MDAKKRFRGRSQYEILASGILPEAWHDEVAGMHVETIAGSDGLQQTLLTGTLRDQAELSGVLDVLLSLHLEIIKVERSF